MKRTTALLLIALAPTLAPTLASAQRGGFGRGGRAPTLAREAGITIPTQVNMINLLIEHRQDLALSDSQFKQVIVLKRALDSTNAPEMRRLDSLSRLFRGGTPMFSSPAPTRRDSLAEARVVVRQVSAVLEQNDAAARDQAYALLDPQQLVRARAVEADAEKARREAEAANGKKP